MGRLRPSRVRDSNAVSQQERHRGRSCRCRLRKSLSWDFSLQIIPYHTHQEGTQGIDSSLLPLQSYRLPPWKPGGLAGWRLSAESRHRLSSGSEPGSGWANTSLSTLAEPLAKGLWILTDHRGGQAGPSFSPLCSRTLAKPMTPEGPALLHR